MRGLLVLLVACGGPEAPALPPTPTPIPQFPEPLPDPWLRTGDVGALSVIREAPTLAEEGRIRVAAVFADDLQGLPYAAPCDRLGELCVPADAPRELPIDVRDVRLDPDGSRFAWVGDYLGIGPVRAPFEVFADHPTAGYAARYTPTSPPDRLDLTIAGGEWGDAILPDALRVPEPIAGLSPDPGLPVVTDGTSFQVFRWEPSGAASMVLTTRAEGVSTAQVLDDDGEVAVDLTGYRFHEPLWVELWEVGHAEAHDVDGNTLEITPIAVQGWCVYDTCRPPLDFPEGPDGPEPVELAFTFCWSASSCGQSRWFLAPDGSWSSTDGYIGTWTFDCCSQTLSMRFTSGTEYRGRFEDGCFDGEMTSWSGNQGVWGGCL